MSPDGLVAELRCAAEAAERVLPGALGAMTRGLFLNLAREVERDGMCGASPGVCLSLSGLVREVLAADARRV